MILTAPEETLKSPASKLATPLLDVLASSPATVIVLPEAVVLIPSPAAISKEESSRFTDPVPVSADVFKVVLIATSPILSMKPEASTVITGISVTEPYEPAVTPEGDVLARFVNVPESGVVCPIAVPSINPPSILTLPEVRLLIVTALIVPPSTLSPEI